jgi:hypothetical protein
MGRGAAETDMWGQLVIDSLTRPRAAARRLLSLDLEPAPLVQAAVAITCAGLVLGWVAMTLSGGAVDPVSAAVLQAPLLGALAQFAVMGLVILLTFRIGRMFGGRGGFWGAAAVVVWLNAVTLLIQVVQIVALAVAPPFAGLIAIATLVWLLWAYASFVTELHDFSSPLMVLGVAILTVIVLIFALTLLAAMLGLSPQVPQ